MMPVVLIRKKRRLGSTVSFVNSAPTVLTISQQSGTQGVQFSINLLDYFSDPDGDVLMFSTVSTLPAGLALIDGYILGTPTAIADTTGIVVSATDGTTNVDSASFTISIAAAAPAPTPIGETWLVSAQFADVGVLNASSSAVANGEEVMTWQDQSGNGNHWTQVNSALRWTYYAADSVAGGLPSVGTDSIALKRGMVTPSVSLTSVYFVVAFGDGTTSAFTNYEVLMAGVGTTNSRLQGGNTGTVMEIGSPNFAETLSKNGYASDTSVLPTGVSIIRAGRTTADTYARTVGYWDQRDGRNFTGRFLGVLMCNGSETIDDVNGWIAQKYSLESKLTPANPYSTNPNPLATYGLWDSGPYATGTDIVFEDNFNALTGYERNSDAALWNGGIGTPSPPPGNWDGVKAGGASAIKVISGAGVSSTNALRLLWDPAASQPTVSLGKHLSGDIATGYDELFMRYNVKLPDAWMAGDFAANLQYWKWGRLWQNTDPTGAEPGPWHENRVNSGFVVWGTGGNIPYTRFSSTWAEDQSYGGDLIYGSSGGPRQSVDYFISGSDQHNAPGYFESIWDIDTVTNPGRLIGAQAWHTLEFRFLLATDEVAEDGVFEMWWDGVSQGAPVRTIPGRDGTQQRNGIPTERVNSGFNFFTLFDNMSGWNSQWSRGDVDGWLDVNDVVVATKRIGHTYIAGNTDNTGAGAT